MRYSSYILAKIFGGWVPEHNFSSILGYLTSGFNRSQPDAEEFDPERWLDYRHKQYVVPNPFIFLPFNAGPRIVSINPTRVLQDLKELSLVSRTTVRVQVSGLTLVYGFLWMIVRLLSETSFFLIRLLQRVDVISLAPECQPTGSRPPATWAGAAGRKGIEKIWPKAHLTLYSVVCPSIFVNRWDQNNWRFHREGCGSGWANALCEKGILTKICLEIDAANCILDINSQIYKIALGYWVCRGVEVKPLENAS